MMYNSPRPVHCGSDPGHPIHRRWSASPRGRTSALSTISAIVAALVLMVLAASPGDCKGAETLRFADDFKDFDLKKWKHEITMGGGGNWEFQIYHNSRQNSYTRDGILYLKPTLTADLIGEDKVLGGHRMDMWGSQPPELCTGNQWWGCERTSTPTNILNPLMSARLRTAETFTFKYGRVEVRAKMPYGDWLWPAIWMMPAHNSYGQWPASGEIDIAESRGNDVPGKGFGVDTYFSTLHWGPNFDTNGFKTTTKTLTLPGGRKFSDEFHVFGLYWDEDQLYTYLDDPKNVVFSIQFTKSFWDRGQSIPSWSKANKKLFNPWRARPRAAPFDQEFYLILNCAVGGTMNYFPDSVAGKPWSDKSPTAVRDFYNAKSQWMKTWNGENASLQIDSVKIWTFPNSEFHYPRGKFALGDSDQPQRLAAKQRHTARGVGSDSADSDEADADADEGAASNAWPQTNAESKSVLPNAPRSPRLNLKAALEAPPDTNESVPFLVMSIVALVIAVAALASTGLIALWAKKRVRELDNRMQSSSHNQTPIHNSNGAGEPLSPPARIDAE